MISAPGRAVSTGECVAQMICAHGDGNYFADTATLDRLEGEGQVVFRYCDPAGNVTPEANANGAQRNIAGIADPTGHILGMMPHPENAAEAMLGSAQEIAVAINTMAPPGSPSTLTVRELWGDYTYQFGVVYTDRCAQRSALESVEVTTVAQKFQTVEGFCFTATAAYGAPWTAQVAALRAFRDSFLK